MIATPFKAIHHSQSAFTLVEVAIVVPMMLLIAMVGLNLIIEDYGQILLSTARISLDNEAQNVIMKVREQIMRSTGFGDDIGSQAPQPYKNGTYNIGNFYNGYLDTDGHTTHNLIVYSYARDAAVENVNANLLHVQNATGPYATDVLDFFRGNLNYNTIDGGLVTTLYKRNITPTTSLVTDQDTPANDYLQSTCNASAFPTTDPVCQAQDIVLTTHLRDMSVYYFNDCSSSSGCSDDVANSVNVDGGQTVRNANRVKLSLTLYDAAYGQAVTTTKSLTIKKLYR